MKKLFHITPFFLMALLAFIASCKKDDKKKNDNEICFSVFDNSTHLPVVGASVTIEVEDPNAGHVTLDGTTNTNGIACIDFLDFTYLDGYSVSKQGYEENCESIGQSIAAISKSITVFQLKRNSFIKFHFVNQPPVFASDSLELYFNSSSNLCSGEGNIHIPPGTNPDTTIVSFVIAGNNGISWYLFRNQVPIKDSLFYVSAPIADTSLVEVNY